MRRCGETINSFQKGGVKGEEDIKCLWKNTYRKGKGSQPISGAATRICLARAFSIKKEVIHGQNK